MPIRKSRYSQCLFFSFSPGLLKLSCFASTLEEFFLGGPLMDSLDVNDTCKRRISLQKHSHLVCQDNLFRVTELYFATQMESRPIVWEALV